MYEQERPCRSIVMRKDKQRSYLKKPDLVKKEQRKHRQMLFAKYRLRKNDDLYKEPYEVESNGNNQIRVSTTRYYDSNEWVFVEDTEQPKETYRWWKFWKFL